MVSLAVSVDQKCNNLEKYQDLLKELRKIWNMKVRLLPIVVSAPETVSKNTETVIG